MNIKVNAQIEIDVILESPHIANVMLNSEILSVIQYESYKLIDGMIIFYGTDSLPFADVRHANVKLIGYMARINNNGDKHDTKIN